MAKIIFIKPTPTCTAPCAICGDPHGLAVPFDSKIEFICSPCGRKIRQGVLTFNRETNETVEVLQ